MSRSAKRRNDGGQASVDPALRASPPRAAATMALTRTAAALNASGSNPRGRFARRPRSTSSVTV
jgi:hypothetical protein